MISLSARACISSLMLLLASGKLTAQTIIQGGRMAEVFQQTILSPANVLNDPWEITYGADGYLWITEAKGYKVYRMNPATGAKTTVLDISQNSTFLPLADRTFNVQFPSSQNPWPQGGCAGLALHPDFMNATAPKNYVYISYVYSFTGYVNNTPSDSMGIVFVNRLVRFTYNTTTAQLESPVSLCDTLPGSSDHNSQRIVIAPVTGTDYLFYAQGDMGAGQFGNKYRRNKAQFKGSYEGKILRFNLEPDADAGTLDKWIPADNPFNGAKQSAVWCTGIRNNQGFAVANINGTDLLYGSSHGPYSDDEINIIEQGRNYGHPLVVGYAADNNYNNSSVGTAPRYSPALPAGASVIPLITSETSNAATIGSSYKDPIFSAYPATQASVNNMYRTQPANGGWPSEAWSGMDIYTNTVIPGWKNSLVLGSLKWGRVLRLKLDNAGTTVVPTNGADTVSYFGSTNRYRDVAFSPDGRDLFVIMDKSTTTSGPSAANPVVPACGGCVQRYRFLGYHTLNNRSAIPTSIPVTLGAPNTCNAATTITIDATNNTLWVPITGPDGNIMAELKANGNNLGTVTASFYTNSSFIRKDVFGKPYLDRNMTITPQTQPTTPVTIRLYMTDAELNALKNAPGSGITSVANLHIYKNSDACGITIANAPLDITPVYAEAFGANGYVLQASINSFSSFYFAGPGLTTLPLQILFFKGSLQTNDAVLQWETANERNTDHFNIERSTNGVHFEKTGTVTANGSGDGKYAYTDKGAALIGTNMLYYRLKTIDKDGAVSYSNIVLLHVAHNMDVMVFPNPVKNILTIRTNNSTATAATVQVSDVQGRVVYTNQQSLHAGTNNIMVDVRHWTPQLYVVKIINAQGKIIAMQKFEKAA